MFYTMSMSSDIIVSHHLTLSHMPLHSYASSCSKAKREKEKKKIKYKGPEQIITSQTSDHTHIHTHKHTHTHTHTLSLSLFSTKKKQKKKRHFISPWPNQLWLQNCLDLSLSLSSLIPLSSLSLILSNITCTVSLSLITSLPVRDKILLRHHIPLFFESLKLIGTSHHWSTSLTLLLSI